ncbi:MAG: PAS domain S-box protein [Candidatus Falkowbacteria bacterium]
MKNDSPGEAELSKLYQNYFLNSSDAIFIIDRNEIIITCNSKAIAITQENGENSLIGKLFYELPFFQVDTAGHMREIFNKCLEGIVTKANYRPINSGDTTIAWVSSTMSPIYNGNAIEFVQIVSRDMTSEIRRQLELQESKQRFKDIVLSSSNIAWEINSNSEYTYCSKQIEDTLGYSPNEIIGITLYDLMPENEQARIKEVLNNIAAEKKAIVDLENWNLHKNGQPVCFLTNGYPIQDKNGELLGYRGISKDVTKRKKHESNQEMFIEILKILNETYSLEETIDKIISIIKRRLNISAVGIRLKQEHDFPYYASKGFDNKFLIAERSLISKNQAFCHNEQGEISLECTCGLVVSGKTDSNNQLFTNYGSAWINNLLDLLSLSPEQDPRHNPRNRCIHEGYLSVALIPLKINKEIIGLLQLNDLRKNQFTLEFINFMEGISIAIGGSLQRKQIEKALEDSQQKMSNILEMMPEVVFQIDSLGNATLLNKQSFEVFGYTEKEIGQGMNIFNLIVEEDRERGRKNLSDSIQGVLTGNNTYRFRTKDGTIISATVYSRLLNTEHESPVLQGILIDVTEQIHMREDLVKAMNKAQESDRLKSAFLANISHEIRTPMNGILGFSNLLLDNITCTEDREYLNIIKNCGNHLLDIINDVVDLSKIEAGQMNVNQTVTSVNEQFGFVYDLLKLEAKEKNIGFIFKKPLADGDNLVITDKEKVRAILLNLIKNAIKNCDEGLIEFGCAKKIDAENKSEYLEFFIKDSGIGIPEDMITAIFDRFIQVDNSRATQGTGLGLSICQAYVKMLGGEIWVESEIDKGSTFYFTIPFIPKPDTKEAKSNLQASASSDLINSKLLVLIAEDDKASKKLLEKAINKFIPNANIIFAFDGKEAVEIFQANQDINLILMDIKLPKLDGYSAIRQIRSISHEVIIITQTAHALSGDKEKALEAGSNDYIQKPIDWRILESLLKKYY